MQLQFKQEIYSSIGPWIGYYKKSGTWWAQPYYPYFKTWSNLIKGLVNIILFEILLTLIDWVCGEVIILFVR